MWCFCVNLDIIKIPETAQCTLCSLRTVMSTQDCPVHGSDRTTMDCSVFITSSGSFHRWYYDISHDSLGCVTDVSAVLNCMINYWAAAMPFQGAESAPNNVSTVDIVSDYVTASGDPGIRHNSQLQHVLHLPRHCQKLQQGPERCRQKWRRVSVCVSFASCWLWCNGWLTSCAPETMCAGR